MSEWTIVQSREPRLVRHECRLPSLFTGWLWGLKRGAIITCRAADPEGLIEVAGMRLCGRSYRLESRLLGLEGELEWRLV